MMIRTTRNSTPCSQKTNKNRQGAAVVEAALLLPLLIFLTFGAIDMAQYIHAAQVISNSSREGVRIASRSTTNNKSEVEAAVLEYFAEAFPQLSEEELGQSVSILMQKGSGESISDIANGDLTAVDTGTTILVTVDFSFSNVRWLQILPSYGNLSTVTYGRRE